MYDVKHDGDCLFNCIAKFYYGDVRAGDRVRGEIVDALLKNHLLYKKNYEIYEAKWVQELTGVRGGGYDSYVAHVKSRGKFGDLGCLRVFELLHPGFVFTVWTDLLPQTKFTSAHKDLEGYVNYNCPLKLM